MFQVIVTKRFSLNTKTFKFDNLNSAQDFALKNEEKLVDILEKTSEGFNSLMF